MGFELRMITILVNNFFNNFIFNINNNLYSFVIFIRKNLLMNSHRHYTNKIVSMIKLVCTTNILGVNLRIN